MSKTFRAALAPAIVFISSVPVRGIAGTTGQIAGTVTAGGVPVAGVTLTAESPTGRYETKTGAQGYDAPNRAPRALRFHYQLGF